MGAWLGSQDPQELSVPPRPATSSGETVSATQVNSNPGRHRATRQPVTRALHASAAVPARTHRAARLPGAHRQLFWPHLPFLNHLTKLHFGAEAKRTNFRVYAQTNVSLLCLHSKYGPLRALKKNLSPANDTWGVDTGRRDGGRVGRDIAGRRPLLNRFIRAAWGWRSSSSGAAASSSSWRGVALGRGVPAGWLIVTCRWSGRGSPGLGRGGC